MDQNPNELLDKMRQGRRVLDAVLFLENKLEQPSAVEHKLGSDAMTGIIDGLDQAQELCHFLARASGWWHDPVTGEPKDRNNGEMIALMHSELSEGLEALRKDLNDDHLPHRKGIECELADTMIRIFDFAGARGLDLAGALVEKLAYNQQRADHKLENRANGGKAF